MVKTFEEWKSTVKAQYDELNAVRIYLNEKGEERRQAFDLLYDMANFCSNATELVDWIDTKERLDQFDCARLQSGHAVVPISRLRKIAANEVK